MHTVIPFSGLRDIDQTDEPEGDPEVEALFAGDLPDADLARKIGLVANAYLTRLGGVGGASTATAAEISEPVRKVAAAVMQADKNGQARYANSFPGEFDNFDLQGPSPSQRTLPASTPSSTLQAGGRQFYLAARGPDGIGEYRDSGITFPEQRDFQSSSSLPAGYAVVRDMTPRQVHELRNSGERNHLYGGRLLPNTDKIKQAVGYTTGDVGRQTVAQAGANLDNLQSHVKVAVAKYPNVPPDLLNALILNESRGMANAVSDTGALGPMQLVAANYYLAGGGSDQALNPFDPAQAVNRGAALLSGLISTYGNDNTGIAKALTAYNQGQGAVDAAIRKNQDNYLDALPIEAGKYAKTINAIRAGTSDIKAAGYFGTKR